EAVGDDGPLAVGVDDLQVVQAVRGAGEVEAGDDLGGVDDLVDDRLVLGDAGTHQLDDGVGGEAHAADGGGDVLGVAAHVGVDAGDGQRHDLGDQLHGGVGRRLGEAAHQDVVEARLRGRDDRPHVRRQPALVGGVVAGQRRRHAVAQEHLVG